ncbi:MAG TPA: SET domain-containing protein-lysine N-methyltransferase [Anaerolineae bacterium]|nr:SET domain-containing protein-lysine N-methyltransferase [Anaerolineae bacterium]
MAKVRNPKLGIKDTNKYGLGVFALESIKANELVSQFTGEEIPASEVPAYPEPDYFMQVAPGKYIGPSGYEDDMINHSCEPNCVFNHAALQLTAIRDIPPGEEITYDYASIIFYDDNWSIPCKCGTPSCRGIISHYPGPSVSGEP